MDKSNRREIAKARRRIEKGAYREALEALQPLLDIGDPEALFLYSTFSVAGSETEDAFERRSLRLLERAAELGYPPALFALGVCYELGDLVEVDATRAALFIKAAADGGYPKGKFRHGLNLLYGSGGMPQSKESGLALIRAAAGDGVEEAQEFLSSGGD